MYIFIIYSQLMPNSIVSLHIIVLSTNSDHTISKHEAYNFFFIGIIKK